MGNPSGSRVRRRIVHALLHGHPVRALPHGPPVRALLNTAELIALPRNDDRVRPIAMPSFLRKVAVGALVQLAEHDVHTAVGDRQFGVGVPDGTSQAYHTLAAAIHAAPNSVILALDVKAAFPSISRTTAHSIA